MVGCNVLVLGISGYFLPLCMHMPCRVLHLKEPAPSISSFELDMSQWTCSSIQYAVWSRERPHPKRSLPALLISTTFTTNQFPTSMTINAEHTYRVPNVLYHLNFHLPEHRLFQVHPPSIPRSSPHAHNPLLSCLPSVFSSLAENPTNTWHQYLDPGVQEDSVRFPCMLSSVGDRTSIKRGGNDGPT